MSRFRDDFKNKKNVSSSIAKSLQLAKNAGSPQIAKEPRQIQVFEEKLEKIDDDIIKYLCNERNFPIVEKLDLDNLTKLTILKNDKTDKKLVARIAKLLENKDKILMDARNKAVISKRKKALRKNSETGKSIVDFESQFEISSDPMRERIAVWTANGMLHKIIRAILDKKIDKALFDNIVGFEGIVDCVCKLKQQGIALVEQPIFSIEEGQPFENIDYNEGTANLAARLDAVMTFKENNILNVSKDGLNDSLIPGDYNVEVKCVNNYNLRGHDNKNKRQVEILSKLNKPWLLYIFTDSHMDTNTERQVYKNNGIKVMSDISTGDLRRNTEVMLEDMYKIMTGQYDIIRKSNIS